MKDEECMVGTRVIMAACLHSGIGWIVDPAQEYERARLAGRSLRGAKQFKNGGLIAVYDPKYPETLWWWLHPMQLTRADK